MEMSALFTQRLSGSSSRQSFNDDALEQLEFNINDISRASSPASVTSTSARSEGHSGFSRDRRYRGSLRGDDEYRRKYSRIKNELEVERIKGRQLQQERVEEMRKLREAFENDRKIEINSLQKRLEDERKKEIVKLREDLIKQKDFELQQVLMYKENERKRSDGGKEAQKSPKEKESSKSISSVVVEGQKEEEEDVGGKDGDNDIVKISEKPRTKVRSHAQSKRSSNDDSNTKAHQSSTVQDNDRLLDNQDATNNKENSRTAHRQGVNVGRLVTKIEMKDASTSVDHKFGEPDSIRRSKEIVSKKSEGIQTNPIPKTDELFKESQKVIVSLEGQIGELQTQNSSLQKEATDIKRSLEVKCKEHKIREDEFMTLKAGYDKQLRTVINEHKKVALGNLEKLKQAETALKEATLTDEEIASLSQRHERQRRLSSSSLPAMSDETKKEDREREKNLQKKLGDLQTQVQRLERRIALLRTENDTLRKKQDDHRPLEEKIKNLKKRNAELAAIARRLEEKAKTLQQENSRAKSRSSIGGLEEGHVMDSDQLKRAFARQRAKDLADHAKSMLAKDHEIEELRKKCQELANELGNVELMQPQNAAQFEEKEELVNIIKQAAKERLQLEQQLAHTKQRGKGDGRDTPTTPTNKVEERKQQHQQQQQQRRELEEANQILHEQVEKLENALHKTDQLERHLTEKTEECQELGRQLSQAKEKNRELEKSLLSSTAVNEELQAEVKALQEQVKDIAKVVPMDVGRHLFILHLHVEVLKIINVICCQFRAFNFKITEECNGLKQNLVHAQREREVAKEEVSHLNIRVQSLENLVKDLQEAAEKVGQLENEKDEAVQQLQQTKGEVDQLQQNHSDLENEHETVVQALRDQVKALEDKRKTEEERGEELAREIERLQREAEARHLVLDNDVVDGAGKPLEQQQQQQQQQQYQQEQQQQLLPAETPVAVQETFMSVAALPNKFASPVKTTGVSPKPRGHWNHNNHHHNYHHQQQHHQQHYHQKVVGGATQQLPVAPTIKSSTPFNNAPECEDPELNELALKLSSLVDDISECSSVEEDPEERKEMDRKHSGRPLEGGSESFLSSWHQNGPIQVYIAKYNYDPFEYSPNENPEAELPLNAGDYVLVVGEMDEDGFFDGELIDGRQGLVPSNFIEKVEDDDLADFHTALMEAGHGELSNSNGPSSNLSTSRPLQTSGNVIVNNNNSSSNNNNNNNNVDYNHAEQHSAKHNLSNGGQEMDDSNSDLEDIAEMDEDSVSVNSRILANGGSSSNLPPCPRGLSIDRQLNTSLLVSWKEPEASSGLEVHSYHVLVDGQLKTSVKASERTKALLENVDASLVHRVCIQCLSNRGQSRDAQCTMLVGKDVYPQPSDLRVSHLSPTSATLSWLPGNTNYQHSIVINGKEMRLVKPGVFRHTLTGLSPGTKHKVTLIAKSISGTLNEEKSKRWVENVTVHTEVTTPEAGSPEPPLNVQAESGPRERSVLLTWLPVTINTSGVSNGTVVSGYAVIADGERVKAVSGATADHVVLDATDFHGQIPSELTLRTVSNSGVESPDSDPVLLPVSLMQELSGDDRLTPTGIDAKATGSKPSKAGSMEDQKGHDTDEEIEAAFREVQHSPLGVDADMASEPYSDTSSSELSDIPEVEEEFLGSHDSNLNHLGESVANEVAPSSQAVTESPKPLPRKNVVSDSGTKEFTSKKPDSGKLLVAPTRVVPAIEITRDSSSDRGASIDEETDKDSQSPTRNMTPTQRSPDNSIGSQYRGNNRNPSAFRQVDQSGRHRDSGNKDPKLSRVVSEPSESQSSTEDHPDSSIAAQNHPNSSQQPRSSSSPHSLHNNNNRQQSPSNTSHRQQNHSPKSQQQQQQQQHHHHHQGQETSSAVTASSESSPHLGRNQSPDHRKNLSTSSSSSHPEVAQDVGGDTDSISGEINSVIDENTVRLFVALFDYDPTTMSPNMDSIEEELPFREGQILKVYGDKDPDGFYRGESQGRTGFIPCNMVSEVQIDDPELINQLLKESMGNMANSYSASASSQTPTNENEGFEGDQAPAPRIPAGMRPGAIRRMVAMYDYDPQELSPNVDAELELSFKTGDFIVVYGEMDEDGFFTGELGGQHGLVPSNFLQPAPLSDEEGLESASVVSATPRSRSGESLETSLNAVGRADLPSNLSQVNEQQTATPNGQSRAGNSKTVTLATTPTELRNPESEQNNTDPMGSSTSVEEEKPKKKTGFFNRGKNIFKKLTR